MTRVIYVVPYETWIDSLYKNSGRNFFFMVELWVLLSLLGC